MSPLFRQALLVLFLLGSWTQVAEATPIIELALSSALRDSAAIELAVRDGLSDFDVELSVAHPPDMNLDVLLTADTSRDSLARTWVRSTESFLEFYVADDRRGRVLIRRLEAGGRPDAVRYEELTQVVRATVAALLEGGVIGITFEEARQIESRQVSRSPTPPARLSQPPPTEATARRDHRGTKWSSAPRLLYEVFGFAQKMPIRQRFGIEALVSLQRHKLEWGMSGAFLLSPANFREDEIQARLDTLLGRLMLDLRSRYQGSWRFHGGFGGGAELVFLNVRSSSAETSPSEARVLSFGALRAEAGPEWRIARLLLGLSVFCDVPLTNVKYVVNQAGRNVSLLDPWPLSPGIGVKLGLH